MVRPPQAQHDDDGEEEWAEGYKLFLSKNGATGYLGVTKENGRFKAAMGWR